MSTLATIVGYIVVVAICVALAAVALDRLFGKVVDWHAGIVGRAVTRHLFERSRQMASQSCWFHTPIERAMWIACAQAMADAAWPDPMHIRERVLPDLVKQESRQ